MTKSLTLSRERNSAASTKLQSLLLIVAGILRSLCTKEETDFTCCSRVLRNHLTGEKG